jgi:hypothetical protein
MGCWFDCDFHFRRLSQSIDGLRSNRSKKVAEKKKSRKEKDEYSGRKRLDLENRFNLSL